MKYARQLNQLTQDSSIDGSVELTQKRDQLQRLTAYIENNPDDEDLQELLDKKEQLETEITKLEQQEK